MFSKVLKIKNKNGKTMKLVKKVKPNFKRPKRLA